MTESVQTAAPPPLPYRARPTLVLLGVSAVLLVSAGAMVASCAAASPSDCGSSCWSPSRPGSPCAARGGLRSSEGDLDLAGMRRALARERGEGGRLAGAVPAHRADRSPG